METTGRDALLRLPKEELDRRKAALEIDKAEREGSIERNAKWFVPIAVALVSVTISGTQLWMAVSKDATERAVREQERARTEIAAREERARIAREEERQIISTGIALANFAIANQDVFASSDVPRVTRFVAIIEKTMPDKQRSDLLAALNAGSSSAEVFAAVAESASRSLPPLQQQRVTAAIVAAAPQAPAAGAQGRTYRIYFHITSADDRSPVADIAQTLPARFASQGIELKQGARVSSRGPIEVRHYRTDQRSDAQLLGEHLRAGIKAATGCDLSVALSDLSPRLPNLPDGRMEVWLGDLPPRCPS